MGGHAAANATNPRIAPAKVQRICAIDNPQLIRLSHEPT